ncbi:MAG: RES family NAD+ phosphorylase [Betaproteobacteria bacterium]|nr:RES family NAD+ phosphorylase [Betaproteobacteria bacterium]
MENVFSRLCLSETHGYLVRNIVSLRVSEDLFDDLSGDRTHWESAIKLEIETKPKPFTSAIPIIDRPFEEALWNDAIDYPFKNWMRSRFSDGSFGVWYGGDTFDTTIYETAYHWRRQFLDDAGFTQPGTKIDRMIFSVRCDAALVDFRLAAPEFPALIDPADYTLTHQIGSRLHKEGHPGLITKSARCSGDVYAILNPRVLSNPRQICYLTYTTTGRGVEVERDPGSVLMVIP